MPTPGKPHKPSQDWNPWDIKAALGKRGYSLKRVAIEAGFTSKSVADVLRKQWPRMERAIANTLDVEPWEIWPSRYTADKEPLYRYGSRSSNSIKRKTSP